MFEPLTLASWYEVLKSCLLFLVVLLQLKILQQFRILTYHLADMMDNMLPIAEVNEKAMMTMSELGVLIKYIKDHQRP